MITANEFAKFCTMNGILHRTSAAYTASTNGPNFEISNQTRPVNNALLDNPSLSCETFLLPSYERRYPVRRATCGLPSYLKDFESK